MKPLESRDDNHCGNNVI